MDASLLGELCSHAKGFRVTRIQYCGRRDARAARGHVREPDPRVGHRLELNPYLRRWDHVGSQAGAVALDTGDWMHLEDGVEVYFPSGDFTYRPGDYWQIPARTATGDVEWPTDTARRPLMLTPAGIAVHYAPLAWITGRGTHIDLRQIFPPLAEAADQEAKTTSTKRSTARRASRRSTS